MPYNNSSIFGVVSRFIYTGNAEVTSELAQDLLRAADQYLLEGLKRLSEHAIAQVLPLLPIMSIQSTLKKCYCNWFNYVCFQDLTVENVANVYDLAEAYHALSLRHTCVLFILEQHKQMSSMIGLFSATDPVFFSPLWLCHFHC